MEIREAEELIKPECFETYESQRDLIWRELISLNTNLFTLERIEEFPFKVFLPEYDDRIFWQTTRRVLVETSLMIIWRIAVDDNPTALTIPHFEQEIRENFLKENVQDYFDALLQEIDFEKRLSVLKGKVIQVRHNHLAHLNKKVNLKPDPKKIEKLAISLRDMKRLLELSGDLFDALCFMPRQALWLWGYSDDKKREEHLTDIDKLLDNVARHSHILNLQETEPHLIEEKRYVFEPKELQIVNEYRRKFGLPEIVQKN